MSVDVLGKILVELPGDKDSWYQQQSASTAARPSIGRIKYELLMFEKAIKQSGGNDVHGYTLQPTGNVLEPAAYAASYQQENWQQPHQPVELGQNSQAVLQHLGLQQCSPPAEFEAQPTYKIAPTPCQDEPQPAESSTSAQKAEDVENRSEKRQEQKMKRQKFISKNSPTAEEAATFKTPRPKDKSPVRDWTPSDLPGFRTPTADRTSYYRGKMIYRNNREKSKSSRR